MRTTFQSSLVYAVILLAGCGSAGCGGPPEIARVAVKGTVMLDGKPLENALIRFVSKGDGHDAVAAVTDGSFSMTESDGPTIGEHGVLILPSEPELEQAIVSIKSGDRDPLNSQSIPAKYQSPGRLQATVQQDGENRFTFELKTR